MANKHPLTQLLAAYEASWGEPWVGYKEQNIKEERAQIDLFRSFLAEHDNPFVRACVPGHFTGSALVVDPELNRVLLTHHKKLDKWLQLGGHADGDEFIDQVAMKEVQEESGLAIVSFLPYEHLLPAKPKGPVPFDLDCHPIPARKDDPDHNHYDMRFVIVAKDIDGVVVSEESHDVRWFTIDEARQVTNEWSMHRQFNKLEAIRERLGSLL